MDTYGTDAFRFTLAALAVPGVRDIRLAEERVEGYRNFANKLWNAARFVLGNLEGYRPAAARSAPPGLADRWILSRLNATTHAVRARRCGATGSTTPRRRSTSSSGTSCVTGTSRSPSSPSTERGSRPFARAPSTRWSPSWSRPCVCCIR